MQGRAGLYEFAGRDAAEPSDSTEGEARMSVADCEIEPEDDEWCAEHNRYKPCRICKDEVAEFIAEAMREEGVRS